MALMQIYYVSEHLSRDLKHSSIVGATGPKYFGFLYFIANPNFTHCSSKSSKLALWSVF